MRTFRAAAIAAFTLTIAAGIASLAPTAAVADRPGIGRPGTPPGIVKQCFKPLNVADDSWSSPQPRRCPRAVSESTHIYVPLTTLTPNFDAQIPVAIPDGRYYIYLDDTPMYWSTASSGSLYLQIDDPNTPKGVRTIELYNRSSQLVGWFEVYVDYDW